MLGAVVGSKRGLEPEVAHRYQQHMARGSLALAVWAEHRDAPQSRAILIESGAFDVRNVEGSFVAKRPRNDEEKSAESGDDRLVH